MSPRKPLRPANLKELVNEILDRLHELSDEQLENLSIAADQHIFDRDVTAGRYPEAFEDFRDEEDYYHEIDDENN